MWSDQSRDLASFVSFRISSQGRELPIEDWARGESMHEGCINHIPDQIQRSKQKSIIRHRAPLAHDRSSVFLFPELPSVFTRCPNLSHTVLSLLQFFSRLVQPQWQNWRCSSLSCAPSDYRRRPPDEGPISWCMEGSTVTPANPTLRPPPLLTLQLKLLGCKWAQVCVGQSGKFTSAMVIRKNLDNGGSKAVEDIEWDALTVKETCREIEKRYLCLASAPDPTIVSLPLPVANT
ncbi:hypothetical protein CRG98_047353 [Punica granatum]|uniref:Uncharacterized protein n=1 Tax=Punica granatum TaxID=22663 RepID=A0A2I0HKK4_PUNGR|nr:hypothetical protein CRG98_047353 [Punica granatum]